MTKQERADLERLFENNAPLYLVPVALRALARMALDAERPAVASGKMVSGIVADMGLGRPKPYHWLGADADDA